MLIVQELNGLFGLLCMKQLHCKSVSDNQLLIVEYMTRFLVGIIPNPTGRFLMIFLFTKSWGNGSYIPQLIANYQKHFYSAAVYYKGGQIAHLIPALSACSLSLFQV